MQIPAPRKTQSDKSVPNWGSTSSKHNRWTNQSNKKRIKQMEGGKKGKKLQITLRQAEIGWWIIGIPANGKRGFGTFSDKGLNLVPTTINFIKKGNFYPQIQVSHLKREQQSNRIFSPDPTRSLPLVGPPTMITATTLSSLLAIRNLNKKREEKWQKP